MWQMIILHLKYLSGILTHTKIFSNRNFTQEDLPLKIKYG
jgi:hypothetical protein